MDNYDEAMGYAKTAAESAGTALDKYENSYLKSVEASQEKFATQFEEISTTIWNSDFLKGTIDAGSGILGVLTSLIKTLGTIPTLAIAATGALSAFSNKGWLEISRATICPLQSGGNTERIEYKNGIFNKRLYSKCLKWCA